MNTRTWRHMARFTSAVAMAVGLTACGGDGGDDVAPLVRTTEFGAVEGKAVTDKAAYAWLGIPYAKAPVGALRWKPPVDPTAWTATRAAQAFGRSCAQPGSFYAPPKADDGFSRDIAATFGQLMGSEDCLTLSVWRPASTATNLPVVVWFHGGANTVGYTSNPGYDGANFARLNNAVVVSVNYRLGVFGWLRHPVLQTAGDDIGNSGNFGTLDQIKAVQFVNRNIAAFGGDPANVTLMGQSAGAFDVYSLMVSPLTQGKNWFHKAVVMSGRANTNSLASAAAYAQTVLPKVLVLTGRATSANVAAMIAGMSPADIADTLRTAPAEALVLTSPGQIDNIGDGTVLPVDLPATVAAGQYVNVPLMVGLAQDESKMFLQSTYRIDDATRFLLMYDFDPNQPAAGGPTFASIAKPGVTEAAYAAAAAGQDAVTFDAWNAAALNLFQPLQPKTWAYHFAWAQGPEPWKTLYGAGHGMDVPFVFNNFGKGLFSMNYTAANRPGRQALADAMTLSVGAFMRTGNPNHASLGTAWLPWTPGGAQRRLVFDATPTETRIVME